MPPACGLNYNATNYIAINIGSSSAMQRPSTNSHPRRSDCDNTRLVFMALLLIFPACLFAGQLEDGLKAYQDKQYQRAYKLLLPLADKGNAEAQRRIGVMYRHGLGVQKNDKIAIVWYTKAAEQNHVMAQNSLGIMYRFGLGVKKDPKQGAYWLKRAARQGFRKAQENIGIMLLQGDGIAPNHEEAAYWLNAASEAGSSRAQLHLGLLYLSGKGVKKSEATGMAWIKQSALQGYQKAQLAMAKAYRDGLYGLEKNPELARMWYKKAGVDFQ